MEKNNGLILNISLTDIDMFEKLLDVLKEVTEDERIDICVRHEINSKILAIGEEAGINMEVSDEK